MKHSASLLLAACVSGGCSITAQPTAPLVLSNASFRHIDETQRSPAQPAALDEREVRLGNQQHDYSMRTGPYRLRHLVDVSTAEFSRIDSGAYAGTHTFERVHARLHGTFIL